MNPTGINTEGKSPHRNSVFRAQRKGREAFHAGVSVNACPFHVGSMERVKWREAWHHENYMADETIVHIQTLQEMNRGFKAGTLVGRR